jgi:hypothetical protein
VSFDLAKLTSAGASLDQVKEQQPSLWAMVEHLNAAMERIDELTAGMDHRSAPTDSA